MIYRSARQRGISLVAGSAILWSTAGLFVRWAALDTWTLVAWRSLFTVLTLGVIACLRRRNKAAPRIPFGLPHVITIVVTVISGISYIVALQLTSVAVVMTVYAALPFVATAFAFLWLGERVTPRFLVTGGVALAGIMLMSGAVATMQDLWGILAAVVMTCGFAIQLVHAKRHPSLDTVVLIAIAAAVCVPLTAPFAQATIPAPSQLLACALYGTLTTAIAYILALTGSRLITSGEAGLISMLDVVLGPFWVWLFYGERPTGLVLISNLAVLGAVLWYLATEDQPGGDPAREDPAGDEPPAAREPLSSWGMSVPWPGRT